MLPHNMPENGTHALFVLMTSPMELNPHFSLGSPGSTGDSWGEHNDTKQPSPNHIRGLHCFFVAVEEYDTKKVLRSLMDAIH